MPILNSNLGEGKKRVVLVTGASAGLGLEISKQLVDENKYVLILTSKKTSQERFAGEPILPNGNVVFKDLDVTDSSQISSLLSEIEILYGGVDVLINNAGVSERSTVEDSDHRDRQAQMDVNYLGPFDLISTILPSMRVKGMGQIINISSSGGFMAMPTMSSYSASKFALEAASESLWYEMKPWNISVTLIIPGFINSKGYLNTTETVKCHAGCQDSGSPYFEQYSTMKNFVAEGMNGTSSTNQSIAAIVSKVLEMKKPPLRMFVTLESKALYWFRKICPFPLYLWVMYQIVSDLGVWGQWFVHRRSL